MAIEAGTTYYNGFYFPEASKVTISQAAVRDASDRREKYRVYRFTIKFVLYPGADEAHTVKPDGSPYVPLFPAGDDIDPGMPTLRERLTSSGGLFVFDDKGFGESFSISGDAEGSEVVDLNYGPRPNINSITSVFANKAIEIEWSCEVAFSDCYIALGALDKIQEFSYGISWSFAENGCATRTISGMVEIQQTLNDDGTISRSVEGFRRNFLIAPPPGFRRLNHSYDTHPNKRIMNFTFVDQEHLSDTAPHNGMVREDVTETVRSRGGSLLSNSWDITISGSFEVAKGFPKYFCWIAFLQTLRVRRAKHTAARQRLTDSDRQQEGAGENQPGGALLTTNLEITEDVFGRSMSFSVSYILFSGLSTLWEASGLLQVTPDRSWQGYTQSMLTGDPTGTGPWNSNRLIHLANDEQGLDRVITICDDVQISPLLRNHNPDPYNFTNQSLRAQADCPPASRSWCTFKPVARKFTDTGIVNHTLLGGKTDYSLTELVPGSTEANTRRASSSGPQPNVQQHRKQEQVKVAFYGTASRLGYKIPEPSLIQYGGRQATLVGTQYFEQKVVQMVDNCRLWAARWSGTYVLDGVPDGGDDGGNYVTKPNPRTFPICE